ncbi:zinc finger CCHC domain-containing protein 9 isoform X2 [Mixophyes fleayi]|uniref:zinc finger CCHC domain-containing protein 9 isoform X2 n=1 Tax=Mixophyes fleayi TaxID=3061075 RepID=UPI003F4D8E2E
MTRWARPGHNNTPVPNRKVCAATPWEELHQQKAGAGRAKRAASSETREPQRKKRKEVYVNQDVNGFMAQQGDQGDDGWKDQRRESRRVKRQDNKKSKMICFHCRKPGHGMADCAEALRCQEMGTGICFRCGSTEHEINKCRAKVDPALGEYPYAKCFICGEMGHLSRSCPDNPKGLYASAEQCLYNWSSELR